MRNEEVVKAWLSGISAENKSLSTDGERLFSYRLKIAERKHGLSRVYDYTSTGVFKSHTTSCHVGLALQVAGDAFLELPG
ncbi:MAG: hypothetical protein GY915_04040 [bacterium]|jgi:hypothetical protein|nr:hypothetical protein [bacterium]